MSINLLSPRFAAHMERSPATARGIQWQEITKWTYLAAGALALAAASLKWNVAPLAWVAPVPLLLYVRRYGNDWASRVWLLIALIVGANLMTLKFFTDPVPLALVPAYGVPIAIALWLTYLAWNTIRIGAGERWALYTFPALLSLVELSSYRLTEFGVWGASANTQLEDLRLLQLASIAGVSGIGFVLAWCASLIATLIVTGDKRSKYRKDIAAFAFALAGTYAYGSYRLHAEQAGPTLRVAGIVADLGPTPTGLPDAQAIATNTDTLFARSEAAATRGARLVIWNEAATVVEQRDESLFVKRGAELARRRGVDLVLAYIVPLTGSQYRMENKYVWLSQDGEVLETYFKHHPVPGEGSVKGTNVLRLIDRPYGKLAGAICYDYDFPAMSLAHSKLGAGIVVVPASDWRGIDPYHTQMAKLRAIEGGFSVVRPVRWATSGAFDAYGRQRAAMSHFEDNDRVMMATVPITPVGSLYSVVGDSWALVYGLIVAGALARAARGYRRRV
jgi:apolipoprotein N-acyltransferase